MSQTTTEKPQPSEAPAESKIGNPKSKFEVSRTELVWPGTRFTVDYRKPSGAIGCYHPDWVVVQKDAKGEVNWIIKTKGRVWEGTEAKDEAIEDWCKRVSARAGERWKSRRVNQSDFDKNKPTNLAEAVAPQKKAALL